MEETFDLAVAYRIYPKVSKTPFIYQEDKLRLAELGIRTFKESLGPLKVKLFFLLDNCPISYEVMIRKYFNDANVELIHLPGIGNLPSFGKQIDLLLQQKSSDYVFFAEDDYVYRPNQLEQAVLFLKTNKVDFITPYDHLDSYVLPIHTFNRFEITSAFGLHWRTAASTCLTFLTKKQTLKETESVFRSYCKGNWDSSLWFALTKFNVLNPIMIVRLFLIDKFLFKTVVLSWVKTWRQIVLGRRYKLWQPIPSVATHMEKDSVAPNVDWLEIVRIIDGQNL
jgi:hypothetical protein